ncbi:MAG TPA: DNA-3-methyladenine glycosylase 2 family protein, partial [Pseudomonadota bacterium]|nr:DNA-3-methyladenine glycosylase 2 family protein [Pseudomonadota bacterium]HRA36458.1 DNA-3-methyladenine glycosylase 2 family protein [Pseudomonadota bacterium]
RLTAVRGIGRWTVEMMLIFRLGRADVLPVDDLGVRRGAEILLGRKRALKPRRLAEIGQRWAPFRTLASLYLWRIADFPREAAVKRSQG